MCTGRRVLKVITRGGLCTCTNFRVRRRAEHSATATEHNGLPDPMPARAQHAAHAATPVSALTLPRAGGQQAHGKLAGGGVQVVVHQRLAPLLQPAHKGVEGAAQGGVEGDVRPHLVHVWRCVAGRRGEVWEGARRGQGAWKEGRCTSPGGGSTVLDRRSLVQTAHPAAAAPGRQRCRMPAAPPPPAGRRPCPAAGPAPAAPPPARAPPPPCPPRCRCRAGSCRPAACWPPCRG